MVPPSVRSLFFRSKTQESVKPIPQEQVKRITDDDLLALIDDIFMQARDHLSCENYYLVMETFLFLTEYDILFKKIISSQLSNVSGAFQDILNEDIMTFMVMIQSYFNSFRINLLSIVVEHLFNEYSKTMTEIKENFNSSLNSFNKTNSIMMFMISQLKNWHAKHAGDYFYDMQYEEAKNSFLELKLLTAKQLQKLINTQLHML